MTDTKSRSTSKVLVTLNKRRNILALLTDGAMRRQEILRQVEDSKTTVYRSLSQLEEVGLVESTNDGYRLNRVGKDLFQRFDRLYEYADIVTDHRRLVNHLPEQVDPSTLKHGETVRSKEHGPQAPYRRLKREVAQCSSLTALTPVLQKDLVDVFCEQVESNQLSIELFTSDEALSILDTRVYESLLDGEDISVRVVDQPLEHGVYIADDTTLLTLFSDNNQITAIHITDSDAVIDPFEDLVHEYRERATPGLTTS